MRFSQNSVSRKLVNTKLKDQTVGEDEIERKVSVIFATDVVSYSLAMEAAETKTVKNLRKCWDILDELFLKHGGKIFNTGGDSVLAEFKSAVGAVECAAEYQKRILDRNTKASNDEQLIFRIGINLGDVIEEGGNLLGEGVNIAARLEAFAQPGGVCISKSIYELVGKRTNFTFIDLGQQKVKNTFLHAFDVEVIGAKVRAVKISSPASRRKLVLVSGAVTVAFFAAIFIASQLFQEKQSFKGTNTLISIDHFMSLMRMEKYSEAINLANTLSEQDGIRSTAKAEALNLLTIAYLAENNMEKAKEVFNQQKELESRVSISSLKALWHSEKNSDEVDDMLVNLQSMGL